CEGHVDGRWKVHQSSLGLVVVNVERDRIHGTIPADDVVREMLEQMRGERVAALDDQLKWGLPVRGLAVRQKRLRNAKIPVAVRGIIGDLSVAVAKLLGNVDESAAFKYEKLRV